MSEPELGPEPGSHVVTLVRGRSDVVAFALHAGHEMRPELLDRIGLSDAVRTREEDPHTAGFAPEGATVVRAERSRFEVDLNRPRARAVYLTPDEAWGLRVWPHGLTAEEIQESLSLYDGFYAFARRLLSESLQQHRRVLVLDLHSYNHRRDGVSAACAPVAENPEINIGTRHIDRGRWAPVVEGMLRAAEVAGFEAGENVKFGGGYFSQWVAEEFGTQACVLAIEFKKTFMDEWTGELDRVAVRRITDFMSEVTPVLVDALEAS